jgi:hypothetical protein
MHEQRRGIKQTEPDRRLALEATHLRKFAQGTRPGVRREWLLRRARQCETGSQMSEWLRSPGLQPPK